MIRILHVCVIIIIGGIGAASGQMISSKSIFGQAYTSECIINAPIDRVMKRMDNPDSLAKIMDFFNRQSISKTFAKVGDAALFIPFYSNEKNRDYGIIMLTYFAARSEMRFTYEPMDGSYFFQDIYKFSVLKENTTTMSFSKRFTASEYKSPEFVAEQTQWVENCLARLKRMAESN